MDKHFRVFYGGRDMARKAVAKRDYKVPTSVVGYKVRRDTGDIMVVRGERWVTLLPVDPDVDRLWEFSLDTGRILLTSRR